MIPGWVPIAFIISSLGTIATHVMCDEPLHGTDQNLFQTVVSWATYANCGDIPGWFGVFLFVIFKVPMLLTGVMLLLPVVQGLLANPVAGTIASVAFVAALVAAFVVFFV